MFIYNKLYMRQLVGLGFEVKSIASGDLDASSATILLEQTYKSFPLLAPQKIKPQIIIRSLFWASTILACFIALWILATPEVMDMNRTLHLVFGMFILGPGIFAVSFVLGYIINSRKNITAAIYKRDLFVGIILFGIVASIYGVKHSRDENKRQQIIIDRNYVLAKMRAQSEAELIQRVVDNPRHNHSAIRELVRRKSKKAVPVFIKCLHKAIFPRSCAEALGKLKDTRGIPALIKLRQESRHKFTVKNALRLYGSVAVPAIIRELKRTKAYHRIDYISLLGDSKDVRALKVLGELYLDPDHVVYDSEAASALKKFGKASIPYFLKARDSTNWSTRKSMIWNVWMLVVDKHLDRKKSINYIVVLINDPDRRVRAEAVRILGFLKATSEISYLRKSLETESDPDVKKESSSAYYSAELGKGFLHCGKRN
ncbi:hypothetical protein MNBD_GAMMA12-3247 [hydrothermal vent metagenome]|uniref:HEAT repeat domain-containing protein n=1 Tax=hydrothermal vent metagenome TaxID=652676 RepID=A0A3B0ZE40_9ZZZZ